MNKRVALGLAGGLLLVVGLMIGVIVGPSLQALAAGRQASVAVVTTPTPSASGYCQLYVQTVSKDLGVSQSQLQSANKDALQAVINKMYADGKLSQAQKTQAEQDLTKYASDPCATLQAIAKQKGAGSATGGATGGAATKALSGAHTALLAAVAGALKTSPSALQSELSAGKSVAQVTREKGASNAAVDAAYLKAAQGQLAAAVKAGQMTQAQSKSAYGFLQQAVASGQYPLLDMRGGFGAMSPAGMNSPAGMMGPAGMMWG
ncbi:MAG: hypothetical protein ACRDID_08630, partial [Ktedonobacterales bacterium]